MKISLITAVYNREKTIQRALESIKSQTCKDIELVVVDGGSSDKTIDIVKSSISKSDIFITEKDDGIYDALNKGINISSGEIIGFLHSDDLYFDTNTLSKVSKIFLNNNDIDIVYGNAIFFKGEITSKVVRNYRSDKLSVKNLAWGKMPAHTAMFFRKRIFHDYGVFDKTYKISGDYEFLCRIMKTGRINSYYIPETLIKMQLGGISTGGLANAMIINKEFLRACYANGIYTNLFMILSKYPSKIMQYINKY